MATITRAPRRNSAVLTDRKARMLATPLRHVDLVLLGSVLAVSVLGVLMIYSSTQPRLAEAHLDPDSVFAGVKRFADEHDARVERQRAALAAL